jgi:hypothetical protein
LSLVSNIRRSFVVGRVGANLFCGLDFQAEIDLHGLTIPFSLKVITYKGIMYGNCVYTENMPDETWVIHSCDIQPSSGGTWTAYKGTRQTVQYRQQAETCQWVTRILDQALLELL